MKRLTDENGAVTADGARLLFLALDRAREERAAVAADDEAARSAHGHAPCLGSVSVGREAEMRKFKNREGDRYEETLAPTDGFVWLRRVASAHLTNGTPWSPEEMRDAGMVETRKIPGPFLPEEWSEPGDLSMGAAYRRYQDAYQAWRAKASPADVEAEEREAERALNGELRER
jgi:hypothetical protein